MSLIFCKCGCGIQREEFDKKGRKREYIKGHYTKNKECPEISKRQLGRHLHEEWRKNISKNHANVSGENNPNYGKGLFGEKNGRWNGGYKLRQSRKKSKRRLLKFNLINKPVGDDVVFHHLTTEYVIVVPEFINKSINHNVFTGLHMDEVNFFALNYLFLVYEG